MCPLKEQSTRGGLRSVFIALLCALFFLLAMGITLLSSSVYRQSVAAADENDARRTALSYLVNQIRRGDGGQGVLVGTFGGSDAVVLREGDYITVLYCYDGALRELYTEEGTGLGAADGVAVLPLEGLSVRAEGALLVLTATAQGGDCSVSVSPRSALRLTGEVAA